MGSKRRPSAPAPRPVPQFDPTDLAVFVAALLLPLWGSGVLLDELPVPATLAGRGGLALLFAVALLGRRPVLRAGQLAALLALLLVGAGSLLSRAGPVVTPGWGAAPLTTTLPADLETGWHELLRLALLALAAAAALRARSGYTLAGLAGGALLTGWRGYVEYLPQWRAGDPSWRVFAGFANPNQLATWLLITLPLLLVLVLLADPDLAPCRWLSERGLRRASLWLRGLGLLALLLCLAALALTRSRGAMLGLGAGSLAAVVGLARGGRRREALLILAVVGLLGLALALGPLRARLTAGAGLAHSRGFRLLTWEGTWAMARQFPLLGVGLGGWPVCYPIYARAGFTQHAHNSYLQMLAEAGWGGLAALLWLLAAQLRTAWRAAASAVRATRVLGLGLLAAVAGFAAHNLVDSGWYVTAPALALVLFTAAVARRLPAELKPPRRGLWFAGLLLTALLARGWALERRRAEAEAAVQAGSLAMARDTLTAAVARWPGSGLAWEQLAGLLAAEGRTAEALAAYGRAVTARPTAARPRYRRAATLAEAGRLDEALADSAAAVALSPMHLQGYLQLGGLLEQAGRPADARRVYEQMDRLARSPALAEQDPLKDYLFRPTQAYGLLRLAALARAAGDRAAARDAYQRALPVLDRYLQTFANEEAAMAPLTPADRRAMLGARGLREEERAEVRELRAAAEQALAELSAP